MAICNQSPFKTLTLPSPKTLFNTTNSPIPNFQSIKCNTSLSCKTLIAEPEPIFTSVKTFAPATFANIGPGYDFLGCAIDGVGIAAISTMKMLGIKSIGLSLILDKGLPLGSGLGSSAASAAAAAVAVNEMFGGRLSVSDLVLAGLDSEAKVSGYHADNVAPAIMGGFVLIRSYDPLELIQLKFPFEKDLFFVLVSPEFEAPTKEMRKAVAKEISLKDHTWNSSQAGALVAAVLQGDLSLFGKAMSSDKIVEPARAPLIPGMQGVKRAALEAGAFGCTISGAGPTVVAVIDDEEKGKEIGSTMVEAFFKEGNLKASATVRSLDRVGARLVGSEPR
ncbi:hypothetical protein AQUCO_02200207v1 [Aquilegia coerulea]|uniref:Homoserine kinase n=1 Tax=Aquilegia coerulea TaxID=218851 RepID=A0A2G5DDJ7_AQUCA|nr:hypothetical protein AQUCO_02200207v1 [Aquilegia coerulea]